MLKVGFIFPSSDYLNNPFKGDPHTHFQILTVLDAHFGKKVNLSLIDLRGIKKEFAIYHIPECDVYMHSVYTLDYDEQISIVKSLRDHYPKSKHIAGGPHAAVFQKECLKIFDALVLGDGEESIVQAITDIMNSRLKDIYEQSAPIDVNLYPYPKRECLPKSTVARTGLMTLKRKKGFDKLLGATVVFSRGCPYQCHFCAMPQIKKYNPGVRYRRPDLIKAEIEYLKADYGIEGINILDEIGIPPDPKQAVPHLEAIAETGIRWRGQCRVDGISPQIAKLAKKSGCIAMGLGVESVSQRALDIINKKIDLKQVREAIHNLKSNDIEVRLYMIMGLPGEPDDIVDRSWDFIKETEPDLVFLCLFTVRPGTEVFNRPKEFGIKDIKTDWSKTMHMFNRYDKELPTLTFEYEKAAPWGRGFSSDEIIENYLALQARLKKEGLNTL